MQTTIITSPPTTYDIWFRVPGQIRAWRLEGEVPETVAEVIAALRENDDYAVERIIRYDYDVAPVDVTDEIWEAWEEEWSRTHSVDAGDELPSFLSDHAPTGYYTGWRGAA